MKRNAVLIATVVLTIWYPGFLASSDSGAQDSWRRDLLAWRTQRAANLQAPEGWLSLIGLEWLKEGDNSFGAGPDNRIQIAAKVPARLATVRFEKGVLRLLPPVGGFPKQLLLDGHAAQEQVLSTDDGPNPCKLTVGTVTIIVIHRDDRFALRIKDLQAPTRTGFHGLRWYAPNPAYRIHARWIPYDPPKVLDIPTVLGTVTHLPAPGVAEFYAGRKDAPS